MIGTFNQQMPMILYSDIGRHYSLGKSIRSNFSLNILNCVHTVMKQRRCSWYSEPKTFIGIKILSRAREVGSPVNPLSARVDPPDKPFSRFKVDY